MTFAGQHLDDDARWTGRRIVHTIAPQHGGYTITTRTMSAAILTVRISPHALTSARMR